MQFLFVQPPQLSPALKSIETDRMVLIPALTANYYVIRGISPGLTPEVRAMHITINFLKLKLFSALKALYILYNRYMVCSLALRLEDSL